MKKTLGTKQTSKEEEFEETGFELPDIVEGWDLTPIEEVADIVGGGTPDTHDAANFSENGHAWLTPADLSKFEDVYIERGQRCLTDRGLRSSSATLMPAGTVLMSSRAPIGYLAVAAAPISTNQGFKSFVLKRGIVPEYCFHWLRYLRPYLEQWGSGSTFLEISGSRARQIPLLLAPTEEQQRISGKLADIFPRLKLARGRLAKLAKILKAFRQSVLVAACSGRLTEDWRAKEGACSRPVRSEWIDSTANLDQLKEEGPFPESWGLSTIGKMGTEIQAGKNIRCDEHPPRPGEEGIVKISAVTWGQFNEEESKTLLDSSLFRVDRKINPGDLLISRANTLELVGACVIVGPITRQLMLSDKILRFQVEDDWKMWLLFCLRSPLGRFQIESLATGNQLSMRNISQGSLESIVIPLPPLEEQHEIVRRVEALFKLADKIEERVSAATKRADKLTQAILAKAFRGELVPTEAELARKEGRTYEPASALLARIKAEREAAAAADNGTPRRRKAPTSRT